jgi:hypothetical protein
MTKLSNLELIAKKRLEAYKKASKTITELNFNFFIIEFIPAGRKKKVKNHS